MATVQECEQALHALAARLAEKNSGGKAGFNRSLTCTLSDLDVVFSGQLSDGQLIDIEQVNLPNAQVRLKLSSDDLLSLVDGQLKMASAWASGRVKVEAGVMDMIKLRSIF